MKYVYEPDTSIGVSCNSLACVQERSSCINRTLFSVIYYGTHRILIFCSNLSVCICVTLLTVPCRSVSTILCFISWVAVMGGRRFCWVLRKGWEGIQTYIYHCLEICWCDCFLDWKCTLLLDCVLLEIFWQSGKASNLNNTKCDIVNVDLNDFFKKKKKVDRLFCTNAMGSACCCLQSRTQNLFIV